LIGLIELEKIYIYLFIVFDSQTLISLFDIHFILAA